MDGYAVSCADLKAGAWLPTIGRTAAGEAPGRLCPNSARRIMTGAPVPDGADAVIAQENVSQRGSMLQIGAGPPAGSNVRRRGEDIRIGQRLIAEGATLDWRHIAVLAAQGVQYVSVLRRPELHCCRAVASFATPARVSHPARSYRHLTDVEPAPSHVR
jgi:molybdopterin molybdotransferase